MTSKPLLGQWPFRSVLFCFVLFATYNYEHLCFALWGWLHLGWDWLGWAPRCRLGPSLWTRGSLGHALLMVHHERVRGHTQLGQPSKSPCHTTSATTSLSTAEHAAKPRVSAVGVGSLRPQGHVAEGGEETWNDCLIRHVFRLRERILLRLPAQREPRHAPSPFCVMEVTGRFLCMSLSFPLESNQGGDVHPKPCRALRHSVCEGWPLSFPVCAPLPDR